MTSPALHIASLTLEDFMYLYDTEGAFELINGEKIALMPQVSGHNEIIKKLVVALLALEQKNLGAVFFEAPFVLLDSSDWVRGSRVPDAMFYLLERMSAYKAQNPDWKKKPYILVPDLAVEVISEHDSYRDLAQKVELYLQDGVKMVWVVDPKHEEVTVHEAGKPTQYLIQSDTLSGGDLLPDFQLPVATLFD